ncbi:hypothetical protein NDU88_008276 [Pleurodeles waltl]|uniref:Helix-turn-helix domain-containing protein n=1 Tax=Pleurodeles waltl TaxID=8319 RepID=A0AAV7QU29_PLEWA|nr:hypothetical protein NDU88_008276 [Pleurodeles waltl]
MRPAPLRVPPGLSVVASNVTWGGGRIRSTRHGRASSSEKEDDLPLCPPSWPLVVYSPPPRQLDGGSRQAQEESRRTPNGGGGQGLSGSPGQRESLASGVPSGRVALGLPQKAGPRISRFRAFRFPKPQAPTVDSAPVAKWKAGQRDGGGGRLRSGTQEHPLRFLTARAFSIAAALRMLKAAEPGSFPGRSDAALITLGPLVHGALGKRPRPHSTLRSPLCPREEFSCPHSVPVSGPGPATSRSTQVRWPSRSVARPCLTNLKITMKSDRNQVEFLDVYIKHRNRRLLVPLFTKPTARNSLLHFDSYHPRSQRQAITFSQFLHLRRNCTELKDFLDHAEVLAAKLILTVYPLRVI